MTLGGTLKEISLLTDCGTSRKVLSPWDPSHFQGMRMYWRTRTICVRVCVFFFNSPSKCISFGNIPHRVFKTRFPPALHAVTGLYVFPDNAASAWLVIRSRKFCTAKCRDKGTIFLKDPIAEHEFWILEHLSNPYKTQREKRVTGRGRWGRVGFSSYVVSKVALINLNKRETIKMSPPSSCFSLLSYHPSMQIKRKKT